MEAKQRKIFHSRPVFYGFLTLMLAIASSRYIFMGDVSYIVFVCVVLTLFLIYCLWAKKILMLLVIFATFIFGLGWYFFGIKTFEEKTFYGDCQVVARISDDITYSKYGNKAFVNLENVYVEGEKAGNIYATIDCSDNSEINPGAIISFSSELRNVNLFELQKFQSSSYRDGTRYLAYFDFDDCVVQGNKLAFDEKFRLKIKDILYENMGETNGAVAYAVLFGDKSDVNNEIKDTYKTAGIIHLLTVSGLHVGFLVTLLGFALKKCRVRGIYNFAICAVCLGLYAYLCGFAPSILRAGIMGLVLLATKLSGKCYDNLNTLGLSGILILLFSPLSALDNGFLMSFFCVLGIFTISPWLTKLFKKFLPKFVAESFAISIGAQIGILPFMASFYSTINILTFFINLLVIPIFSVIYPVLFVGVFLVALMPFLGFLLQACGWGLTLVYNIAAFFSNTHLILDLKPIGIFVIGFVFLFFFLTSKYFMADKKVKRVSCSGMFVACCVVLGVSYIPAKPEASISLCYKNEFENIVLTNSKGESVLVGWNNYTFTNDLLQILHVKNVVGAFALQSTSPYIDVMQKFGLDSYITYSERGVTGEIVVNLEQYGKIGEFSFVYKSFNDRILGLEISFDQTEVLILKNKVLSQEALQAIAEGNYDFVIVGKKSEYSQYFSPHSKVLSFYPDSYADANYLEDGNISYYINGNNFKRRKLD